MPADPWSRPTLNDLKRVLGSLDVAPVDNRRESKRQELRVPAELTTGRGNAVSVMTREISREGIGLIHRGAVPLGEARLQLPGDSRAIRRRVRIEWCAPFAYGMFLSGGRLLADFAE